MYSLFNRRSNKVKTSRKRRNSWLSSSVGRVLSTKETSRKSWKDIDKTSISWREEHIENENSHKTFFFPKTSGSKEAYRPVLLPVSAHPELSLCFRCSNRTITNYVDILITLWHYCWLTSLCNQISCKLKVTWNLLFLYP